MCLKLVFSMGFRKEYALVRRGISLNSYNENSTFSPLVRQFFSRDTKINREFWDA